METITLNQPNFENRPDNEHLEEIKEAVATGVKEATKLLSERFQTNQNPEMNLPFHNIEHTKGVTVRTEKILRAIQNANPSLITERDIQIGILAAAFHDTVQDEYENKTLEVQGENAKRVMRNRKIGENEINSANELEEFLKKYPRLFSESDITIAQEAIIATKPGWDTEYKTVFQPNLQPESSIVAQAVALADLGVAGMEGADAFEKDGKALFREENIDIFRILKKGEPLSEPEKDIIGHRMIQFMASQAGFAEGRKQRLEKELAMLPNEARQAVTGLFNKFDETIQQARETAEKLEAMTFEELVVEMGY